MIGRFFYSLLISLSTLFYASAITAQEIDFAAIEVKTTDLGNGLYMLEGLGGNIGLSVGEDGVILIDTQFDPLVPKILAAIQKLTNKPITYIINTHWHFDHTGGNEKLGAKATVLAHENAYKRMAAPGPQQSPKGALPILTFSDAMTFRYNGHDIQIFHPGVAHTDGDAIIHFPAADVIHAGDILWNGYFPFIDLDSGGNIAGFIAGLEKLLEMSGPNTKIIAGHGPLANKEDIQTALAMLKDIQARVAKLMAEGKNLDQIKSLNPLADYMDTWGKFFITADRMLDILYNGAKQ